MTLSYTTAMWNTKRMQKCMKVMKNAGFLSVVYFHLSDLVFAINVICAKNIKACPPRHILWSIFHRLSTKAYVCNIYDLPRLCKLAEMFDF